MSARFIPAPAGNTRLDADGALRGPVHPRACGEHGNRLAQTKGPTGSSPRLRGTQALLQRRQQIAQVHPRACGEHVKSGKDRLKVCGSSPRLRGTLRAREEK